MSPGRATEGHGRLEVTTGRNATRIGLFLLALLGAVALLYCRLARPAAFQGDEAGKMEHGEIAGRGHARLRTEGGGGIGPARLEMGGRRLQELLKFCGLHAGS